MVKIEKIEYEEKKEKPKNYLIPIKYFRIAMIEFIIIGFVLGFIVTKVFLS